MNLTLENPFDQVIVTTKQQTSLKILDKKAVKVSQRKAKYSDKDRIRLKDAKRQALYITGCGSSTEIRFYLKKLGIKLDLRMTAAWVAIKLQYRFRIKELRNFVEARCGLKTDWVADKSHLEEQVIRVQSDIVLNAPPINDIQHIPPVQKQEIVLVEFNPEQKPCPFKKGLEVSLLSGSPYYLVEKEGAPYFVSQVNEEEKWVRLEYFAPKIDFKWLEPVAAS